MTLKFWQRKPAPEQPIKLTPKPSYDVTLAEWRKNENLLSAAKILVGNHTFKCMMDVLDNEHPGHKGVPLGTLPHDRAALQARAEGYQLAVNNLWAMAEKAENRKEPQEKWQPLKVD